MAMSLVFVDLVGVVVSAPPAVAAEGNILPPFDTGQTWNICQGYNNSAVTHTGTSAYGLDLTGAGCDNSAAGRNVRAPMAGTVYYYQSSYGNLCVNVAGGRSYTLTHINSSVTSGSVTAGQLVGTVGAANTRGNNGVAHIHFQMWATANCYSSSGIPFSSANGIRICGAPDMTADGPNAGQNGTWSGTSFTGGNCGASSPPPQWNGVGNATFLGTNALTNGQQMHGNQYIMSDDGRFVLLLQSDGNLVEYTASGVLWQTNTSGYPGAWLGVQGDGNVVLYTSSNVPLWSTGPAAIYSFTIQNDANLVGYTLSGQPMWWTGVTRSTAGLSYRAQSIYNGMTMTQGQFLRSSDRRYFMLVQGDGNIVLYAPGFRVIWNSGTAGNAGAWLGIQSDGNMVIYSASNVALWSTGAIGVNSLIMQSDGNLVAYNASGAAVWATYTVGHL
jgi:hypothetical protein